MGEESIPYAELLCSGRRNTRFSNFARDSQIPVTSPLRHEMRDSVMMGAFKARPAVGPVQSDPAPIGSGLRQVRRQVRRLPSPAPNSIPAFRKTMNNSPRVRLKVVPD